MKKHLRLAFGLTLTVLFLVLMFQHMDLSRMMHAMKHADPVWLFYAVLAFFFGYACRIERWRVMLKSQNPTLSWRSCAGPLFASVAMNNILPFRAGDLVRAFGFNKRLGITAAVSLTTFAIERLLDLLMVIFLLGLSLCYFSVDSSHLIGYGGTSLLLGGAAILLALLYPQLFSPLAFALAKFAQKSMPLLGLRIHQQLEHIFQALTYVSSGTVMLRLFVWSAIAWFAEACVFWFVALALPSLENPAPSWLAVAVGTLSTAIPSTPGYVGTFDYFTAQAMMLFGNTDTASAAYAFLVHAVLWLPASLLGGAYLILRPTGHLPLEGTT